MQALVRFLTHGTSLSTIPLWKLALFMVGVMFFVFASGIERRSSRLIEWLIDPDNIISFTVGWRSDSPNASAVTVIDIDDASYDAWGQPLMTPRDKLFDLVEGAERRGAAIIAVDIDVAASATVEDSNMILARLKEYSARQARKERPTPLILVRGLWAEMNASGALAVHPLSRGSGGQHSPLADANERLDAFVSAVEGSAGNQSILWGSALFQADTTGTIREWRLMEAICDGERSAWRAFPSVGLIAAALSHAGRQTVADVRDQATRYAQDHCEHRADHLGRRGVVVGLQWLARSSSPTILPYLFWPAKLEPFRFGSGRDWAGTVVPLLDIRSAVKLQAGDGSIRGKYADPDLCNLIKKADPSPLSCEALRDRVVVIGATHRDSRDDHLTPLGPMSGVYVVANTIAGACDSLLAAPKLRTSSALWGGLLFAIFAVLAARLRNVFAVLLGGLVALIFLSSVSNWLLIPVSQSYESINTAMIMLAIFLTVGSIAQDVERWLVGIMRRLRGFGAPRAEARESGTEEGQSGR
ncbi:CHASE2 domain-containing protein [Bradyrhizobium sp. 21]|uniref:CHASE2 domain-containing protein n=1 Tax=Bradyrhizobium sp. 21 TaxID=2782666 RepID=UPI001FFAF591|nr:CHASE2 domain-containing protein [Bradyrhizobium sp. 21]MCK1389037.1 CHASE2 domain-containing protein [Bradyrhizobium sp. 21]